MPGDVRTDATFVKLADLALLGGIGRLTRGRMDLKEGYLTESGESGDIREALGGFWLAIGVVVLVLCLAVGTGTTFGRNDAVGLALAGVAAVPAALAMIHGVVDHMLRRDAGSDRVFLVMWASIAVVLWLVFWAFPGR